MKPPRQITREEAIVRLESLCARSEQCSGEIMTKLARWKFPVDDAREILDRLIERRFVDDRRYAEAFVRDKYRFSGWGRMKIMRALAVKRVPREIIGEALDLIDREDYAAILLNLLKAKARTIAEGNTFEGRTKLFRFALSRGFETPLVSSLIKTQSIWPVSSDE